MKKGCVMGRDGFTYMGLLVMILIIGISSAVIVQTWRSVSIIEKEHELIWRGHQFRNAIKGYYEYRLKLHGGTGSNYYPTDLKDLVSDPGRAGAYSYLRQIYADPITGKKDWVLVRTAGGIKGVRSASDAEPLKKAGFDADDSSFTNKTRYSEWQFVYPPVITYPGPPVPGYTKSMKPGGGVEDWGGGGWPTEQKGGSTGWPAQRPAPPATPEQQTQQDETGGGGW